MKHPRNQTLTMDERLSGFIAKWTAARSAQSEKWKAKARDYKRRMGAEQPRIAAMVYADAAKRMRDAGYEIAMLRELRRRAGLKPRFAKKA